MVARATWSPGLIVDFQESTLILRRSLALVDLFDLLAKTHTVSTTATDSPLTSCEPVPLSVSHSVSPRRVSDDSPVAATTAEASARPCRLHISRPTPSRKGAVRWDEVSAAAHQVARRAPPGVAQQRGVREGAREKGGS